MRVTSASKLKWNCQAFYGVVVRLLIEIFCLLFVSYVSTQSFSPLLDTSAQRTKADLGKKLIRSRPSRSLRAGSDQIDRPDWRVHDSTGDDIDRILANLNVVVLFVFF